MKSILAIVVGTFVGLAVFAYTHSYTLDFLVAAVAAFLVRLGLENG